MFFTPWNSKNSEKRPLKPYCFLIYFIFNLIIYNFFQAVLLLFIINEIFLLTILYVLSLIFELLLGGKIALPIYSQSN